MNALILKHGLKQSLRPLIFLSLATFAFFYVAVWSSASFVSQVGDVPIFRDPPEAFRAMLGSADFLTPNGWIAIGLGHPLILALFAAAALGMASSGIAGEIERGTIDLVLSRQVKRNSFLAAKAIAALAVLTIVQASGLLGAILARATVEDASGINVAGAARGFLGSWILFSAFLLIALLISAASSLKSRALGISVGLLVGSFFVNVVALLVDGLHALRYLSLFHYVRADDLIAGDGLSSVAVPAIIGIVAAALAFVIFNRRDISR